MKHELIRHPDGAAIAERLRVEIDWPSPSTLRARYDAELSNGVGKLVVPDLAEPERADGLWRTTCCELFLRAPGEARYCELNFSPSRRWAAYAFADVRSGMSELDLPGGPEIVTTAADGHFMLEAVLPLPPAYRHASLEAAVAAILEDTSGAQAFWALAHPAGKPDFHHPDGFIATLTPRACA